MFCGANEAHHLVLKESLVITCIVFLQQEDVSVQLEALDILSDLLSRFGGKLLKPLDIVGLPSRFVDLMSSIAQ